MLPYPYEGFHSGSVVKNLPSNAEDTDWIPGLRRYCGGIGGGHGNPLQYCCLKNTMDKRAWQAIVHGGDKEWHMTEQACNPYEP